MTTDPRVTPAGGAAGSTPGTQATPAVDRLTTERLGMEVANELGIDPHAVGSSGLTAAKIDQYEAKTHSGTPNGNNR